VKKPRFIMGLPAEDYLRSGCRAYLDRPDLPPDPQFIRHLMNWFVTNVPQRKLTGPDIAAFVDIFAIGMTSTKEAIELAQEVLAKDRSLEAITKIHARYGKQSSEIKKLRAKRHRLITLKPTQH
jgi:hypothetical protein